MDERNSGSTLMQSPADGTDRRRKRKKGNPCKGCMYYGGWTQEVCCCNYFLITGKRRPCEMGAGCTVREDRKQVQRKAMKIKNYHSE